MQVDIYDSKELMTIALKGDLDTSAAQDLDVQLEGLLSMVKGELVIDLGELSYLNSTGIRSFIRLDKSLKPLGKRFRFVNATPRILRIFQYCGLDRYFTFTAEPAEAGGALV
jgi:anti-sigma B factor antagonist